MNMFDGRVPGPDPDRFDYFIYQPLLPAKESFNLAAGQIADISVDAQLCRLPIDKIPEPDPLNQPADNDLNCAFWHSLQV